MVLLVPVHAAGLVALNGHGGAWATGFYWLVHVFRMPLFFAMSGFFLTLLLARKGLLLTARNRTLRIAVPLAVGLVTLVPMMVLAAQLTGTQIVDTGEITEGSPFTFEPNFLWFLWYLLIIDAISICLFLAAPRLLRGAGNWMSGLLERPLWGIAPLAIATALALWSEPRWTAVAANTFGLDISAFLYYALFFCLGATLSSHRGLIEAAVRDAWRWTACAVVAIVPAGILFTFHNSPGVASNPAVHGTYLLIYAIATWTSLLALVGLANRFLNRARPGLRYMADASYWIYLSHYPAMVLVVALSSALALTTAPAFVFVTAASLAFSLLTYPLLVRYTAIGRVLNGRRTRPAKSPSAGDRPGLPAEPGLPLGAVKGHPARG